jgi:hypothetical protein
VRSPEQLLRVLIHSLRFDQQADSHSDLRKLSEAEWRALVTLADEARLTLPLGIRHRKLLPDAVRHRIDRNLAGNAQRFTRSVDAHEEVSQALARRGVPFVVLKGLSHFPYFCDSPQFRPQYDIDIHCRVEHITAARAAMSAIGYRCVARDAHARTDHLPTMVRDTGWRWRGDYYDPDMPLNLELHFRLWDSGMEFFDVAEAEQFWLRRTVRHVGRISIPALDMKDTVRYAAWHITRHLLRGDLRPVHLYEFAHLLDRTAAADFLWAHWQQADIQTMMAEALAARLASECFHCRLNSSVRALISRLPATAQKWFDLFSISPLLGLTRPNKDELLLHVALLSRPQNKIRITTRRLLPGPPPRLVRDPQFSPPPSRAGAWLRDAIFLCGRACYHLRTLGPLLWNGLRWMKAVSL